MVEMPPWPDPHGVLKLVLGDLGAARIVGPRTPPDFLNAGFPVISTRVIGGSADKVTATPRVSILDYAETYDASRDLGYAICQRLLPGGLRTSAGVIDRCEVEVLPIEVVYPDSDVRVHSAVYRLSFRR